MTEPTTERRTTGLEITCEHRPSPMDGKTVEKVNGSLIEVPFKFFHCNRCQSSWPMSDKAPRVVIARLERASVAEP